jgi:alcohol dehydrogenase|eukprot:COSAG06_NODE_35618_length_457_cov_15.977654_1_plen_40_part_00
MGPNAGSHGMAASDFPAILKMVAEGRLKPQELVEREVSS